MPSWSHWENRLNSPKKTRLKKASEIFHPVDPNLHVIDRGTHRKPRKKNWGDAGGAFCPRCNQEAVRFRPRDGVCFNCVRDEEEKKDRDFDKRKKRLKFINQHNARIDKRKGATK